MLAWKPVESVPGQEETKCILSRPQLMRECGKFSDRLLQLQSGVFAQETLQASCARSHGHNYGIEAKFHRPFD